MIIRRRRQAIQEVEPTLQDLLQAGAGWSLSAGKTQATPTVGASTDSQTGPSGRGGAAGPDRCFSGSDGRTG